MIKASVDTLMTGVHMMLVTDETMTSANDVTITIVIDVGGTWTSGVMLILAKDVKNLPVQKEDEVPQDVALEVLEEDPQVPAIDLVVKTRE